LAAENPATGKSPIHNPQRTICKRLSTTERTVRVRRSQIDTNLLASHSRQAKDTKQINKNNCFDWFIQNINTIALVEGI